MLKLRGNLAAIHPRADARSALFTITTNAQWPLSLRNHSALLIDRPSDEVGFGVQLVRSEKDTAGPANIFPSDTAVYRLNTEFDYLKDDDIVFIDDSRLFLHTLFRKDSVHNSILLTEQCNHYCLMCSQPPREIDDSFLLHRAFELISLMPADTPRLGFTGGEPTLYGDGLIELLEHAKLQLPRTSIDILSNGRRFKDKRFAAQFSAVRHPSCTVGIPLYSDDPVRHDYVVQARGAFDETILGILNLKRFGQRVEIRIVVHKQTIDRLVRTCEFICRNLLFVDHVALMGLEITGFTRANLDILWVDPYEYKDTLSEAVGVLNSYGMKASVYNHQLCVVNPDIERNYRRSISDWKNEYLDQCSACSRKSQCGGFFSSSKMFRHSEHIRPFA
jgi:His-Xaa-Ser system radical SAM maturase HxsC